MNETEHPYQRKFYNCIVMMYDRDENLLGTSSYNIYKPDPNYIEGYDLLEDEPERRITQTLSNLMGNGIYYVIIENRNKVIDG